MAMFSTAIVFVLVFSVTFTVSVLICLACCIVQRRHNNRKRRYEHGPTVTVTTTTQQSHLAASPQVIPPYPIDARHPTPASNATGFIPHHPPYPTHAPSMPFPQGQTPYQSGGAPYPPAPYQSTDYSANPPPYDVAVAQPPMQAPSSKDSYQKQSPYNPGYN